MGPLMPCVLTSPPPEAVLLGRKCQHEKNAAFRLPSVAVVAKTLRLKLKAVSLRRKGVLYDLDPMYLLGRSRKK